MKKALVDLFGMKKFLTALVGAAIALGARSGLNLDADLVAAIIGLFAFSIGAQGAADHGVEAAKVKAASNDNTPVPADTDKVAA